MPKKDFNKLSSQNALAKAVLDSAPNGVMAIEYIEAENDYKVVYTNEFTLQLFNKTLAEFQNKRVSNIFPYYYSKGFDKVYNEVLFSKRPHTLEYFSSTVHRWLRLSIVRTPEGLLLIYTDIHEKKKADEALKAQKDLLEEVINGSISSVMSFECYPDEENCTDFICLIANGTANDLLGKGAPLTGRFFSEFFPASSELFNDFRYVVSSRNPYKKDLSLTINGEARFYTVVVNRLTEGIFLSLRDITLLKNTELELVKKTEDLEKSNYLLMQFASIVSHDLKEPLRKIRTYGDLLKTGLEEKVSLKEKSYLDLVLRSSVRMQGLIEDLLKYSTIQLSPAFNEAVDLNEVIKEVLDDLEILITAKKAYLEIDTLPVVNGNAVRLRQLFGNLLNNALKFSLTGVPAEIKLRYKKERNGGEFWHHISMADKGIGFEQKYAEKIFSIFQRLNGKEEFEGNGIGLAICKMIVEQHGGKISAQSSPAKGTVFEIVLPG